MSLDRLSSLLDAFPVRAALFHAGPLCGTHAFDAVEGRAFLHVLRRGVMTVTHPRGSGAPARVDIARPTLLFYPRAIAHAFHNPPADGPDFTCATVHFAQGDAHPIARALPAFVAVPLDDAPGLEPALRLLFDETAQPRCGSRLLADRLFEVVLLQLLRWLLDRDLASAGLLAGLGDAKLARALTAMHDAPCEPWTLARLARVAGMSRSVFSSRFHAVVGVTAMDYLADWRLLRATTLLRQGRPLSLVAHDVGYSSHAALSRAFRQRRGASPRAWLREVASEAVPAP